MKMKTRIKSNGVDEEDDLTILEPSPDMSMEKMTLRFTGLTPLLMHSGYLADPTNPFSVQMKAITSKPAKKKTEEDHRMVSELEWRGSLYLRDGKPCVPGANIVGMFVAAARKQRKGKEARAGVFCYDNPFLVYDGPSNIDKLWSNKGHVIEKIVPLPTGPRVRRTLPLFFPWSFDAEITYDTALVSEEEVIKWALVGGRFIGLMDFRPSYGKFDVTAI